MTLRERLAFFEGAVTASGSDFAVGFGTLETALRIVLPAVPFSNQPRAKKQRVALAWDGLRIVLLQPLNLPPPSDAELHEAMEGLVEDARGVLAQL